MEGVTSFNHLFEVCNTQANFMDDFSWEVFDKAVEFSCVTEGGQGQDLSLQRYLSLAQRASKEIGPRELYMILVEKLSGLSSTRSPEVTPTCIQFLLYSLQLCLIKLRSTSTSKTNNKNTSSFSSYASGLTMVLSRISTFLKSSKCLGKLSKFKDSNHMLDDSDSDEDEDEESEKGKVRLGRGLAYCTVMHLLHFFRGVVSSDPNWASAATAAGHSPSYIYAASDSVSSSKRETATGTFLSRAEVARIRQILISSPAQGGDMGKFHYKLDNSDCVCVAVRSHVRPLTYNP